MRRTCSVSSRRATSARWSGVSGCGLMKRLARESGRIARANAWVSWVASAVTKFTDGPFRRVNCAVRVSTREHAEHERPDAQRRLDSTPVGHCQSPLVPSDGRAQPVTRAVAQIPR